MHGVWGPELRAGGAVGQPRVAGKARTPHTLLIQRPGQLLRAPMEMESTLHSATGMGSLTEGAATPPQAAG